MLSKILLLNLIVIVALFSERSDQADVIDKFKKCFGCSRAQYEYLIAEAYVRIDKILRIRVPSGDFDKNLEEIDMLLLEAAGAKNKWRSSTGERAFSEIKNNVAIDALYRLLNLKKVDDPDVTNNEIAEIIDDQNEIIDFAKTIKKEGHKSPRLTRINSLLCETTRRRQIRKELQDLKKSMKVHISSPTIAPNTPDACLI